LASLSKSNRMSDIYLEPETHTYIDAERNRHVPAVSTVIADLVQFGAARPDDVLHARDRGKRVHSATCLYDLQTLDESSIDYEVAPRLAGWESFLLTTGFEYEVLDGVAQIEVSRMHGHYVYACTKDRSGYITIGRKRILILLEIKATAVHSPVTAVQLAAQREAENRWRKQQGYKLIEESYSVRLTKTGGFDLKSAQELCGNKPQYTHAYNFACFIGCLTRHNWRLNHEKFYRTQYYAEAEAAGLTRVEVIAA
jgi:hypothetical protein